jgi:ABC-type multidrug transport system fused ATPase/permease subunit
VRNADKVIVLDKGAVVEQGTHDQLCEMNGIYKKLVLRQLLTKDKENQKQDETETESED